MPPMEIFPGLWFKNRESGLVCFAMHVLADQVKVKYHESGKETWYHVKQFVKCFMQTKKPTN